MTTCSVWTRRSQKLEQKDARKAQLVKLRFFAGLTTAQAAEVAWRFHFNRRKRLDLRTFLAATGDAWRPTSADEFLIFSGIR